MLDPAVAGAPGFADRADGRTRAGRRARALVACALLAVALHVAFLDGMAGWGARPTAPTAAALSVRTVVSRAPTAPVAIEPPLEAVAPPQVEAIEPARRGPRPKPAPARSDVTAMVMEASTGLPARDVVVSITASVAPAVEAAASAAADAANAAADAAVSPPAADTAAAANAFPPPGEPPPLYPARLPPPATMHYQVRRGFLRGDGEIRWLRAGDAYRLVLEARVGGLPLLVQTSEGVVDGNGLAPLRFLDQRARRSAQAANFVRESGRITFSGSALEWPLVAGSQDRLSWMIELAGIVAADPALLREGTRITMAVVGARGDAAVWSLRYVGRETVETASGSVSAEKLVREGRGANDTTAEIWLDPARWYLPAHAALRSASGAPEYELLLDRIEP